MHLVDNKSTKDTRKKDLKLYLRKKNGYLTYTHKITTIAILENYFWEARIKEVYTKDLFVEK